MANEDQRARWTEYLDFLTNLKKEGSAEEEVQKYILTRYKFHPISPTLAISTSIQKVQKR